MKFVEHQVKGLARCMVDENLAPDRLRVHISVVNPGAMAHPPHMHDGVEAIHMLEGDGTLEIDGVTSIIRANEAIVFDPTKLHGLMNSGDIPMRYIVIITRP